MNLLDELNPGQRTAVETTEGPLLILAGAGTGKTRAITYRIAHLIAKGVPAESILGVTFTNKAADNMKELVRDLLQRAGLGAADPWVSTFHSFCARLLRKEAPRLGLSRSFTIYDEDDQTAALKLALDRLGAAEKGTSVRPYLWQISYAKNHGITAREMAEKAAADNDPNAKLVARVYEAYEDLLRQTGSLDFDDLLLRAAQVLRESEEARAFWQARFRYVLVDEFQDTNRPQYEVMRLLLGPEKNVCVVGDEDQAIYSWRGADINILLRFTDNFTDAKVVRLEENYRSRQYILDAAAGVVSHNKQRLGKTLKATRGEGQLPRYYEARDARAEAEYVGAEIQRLQGEGSAQQIAVLYRANFQARAFEDAMQQFGLHYKIVGGFSFYQRSEVKDLLSYARLAMHTDDDVALLRVLNTPPRGIGAKTADTIKSLAKTRGVSLWLALEAVLAGSVGGLAPLRGFHELVEDFKKEVETREPADFLNHVLDRTGYLDMLEQRDTAEDAGRAENLRELVNAVAEGAAQGETFTDFMDRAALVSAADSIDDRAPVTLLTLHSAKGLEFDHVFLAGLEEGVFPHSRSMGSDDELEEERRLCYVGMTRARETLTLTRAVYRRIYGNERVEDSLPSRFLKEIPGELIETAPGSLADAGQTRRYEPDPEYQYSAGEFERRVRRITSAAGILARGERSSGSSGRAAAGSRTRKPGAGHPLMGVRVKHPTYGMGTIIGVEGEDEDRKLTVSFPDHGTKKLVERYANLVRA
ncbi:MAG: UvrD-helicase domain-containing protein [Candidatus Acidiferrales bacterium]